jgi:hypothetical protein
MKQILRQQFLKMHEISLFEYVKLLLGVFYVHSQMQL